MRHRKVLQGMAQDAAHDMADRFEAERGVAAVARPSAAPAAAAAAAAAAVPAAGAARPAPPATSSGNPWGYPVLRLGAPWMTWENCFFSDLFWFQSF